MSYFWLFLIIVTSCHYTNALKIPLIRKAAAGLATSLGIYGSMGLMIAPPTFAAVKPDFSKPTEMKKDAGLVTISGIITLEDGVAAPETLSKALYITAKPDLGFINSNLLLRKFPAVMSKRIPGENVKFPLQYSISEATDGTEDVALQRNKWVDLPITISVRYDTDGVAATRDSTDLVGKGESERDKATDTWQQSNIALSDRGLGGKLVTR